MALLKAIKNQIPSWKGHRDLILIKILLFTYYGGTACVFPYLAVHMKQIGISVTETAVIHAMLPVAMFIGPPIAGFIADKFGGHRLLLIVSLMMTGLLHTSLLWVPQVQRGGNLNGLTSMSCVRNWPDDGLSSVHLYFRVPGHGCSATEPVNVTFSECSRRCKEHVTYSIIEEAADHQAPPITMIGGHTPRVDDEYEDETVICGHGQFCVGKNVHKGEYELLQTGSKAVRVDNSTTGGSRVATAPHRLLRFSPPAELIAPSCSRLFDSAEPDVTTTSSSAPASLMDRADEQNETIASTSSRACMLVCQELSDDHISLLWERGDCGSSSRTFWIYLTIRTLGSIFMSCCFCLFDTTTMFIVSRHEDTNYGRQRVWPILATAIFPPITGLLVQHFSSIDGVPGVINYYAPFFMLDALLLSTTMFLTFGGLEIKASSTKDTNLRGVAKLLRDPRIDLLIASIFLLGTLWGYVEVFLYWFLMELGSPTYLLGLTLTVGSGVGIPVLFFADEIIKRVGNVTIIFGAFIIYAVRYIGYSLIHNPWWCLIFEAMEIFTVHLLWVSVVTHTAQIVPTGLKATMQGVMGGTHYGFGRGSGSLIGGLLMGVIGTRSTFRWMGIAAAVAGFLYLFVDKVAFRALPKRSYAIGMNEPTEKELKNPT